MKLLLSLPCRYCHLSVIRCDLGLFHQKFDLINFIFTALSLHNVIHCSIIAPDDFHVGRFLTHGIIHNAVSRHIDAHVRRGFIRIFSIDPFKNRIEHRKDLYIPVVIDSRFPISLQVKRIDHIDIIQICRCRFICQIDRMLQRNIPDRESLIFSVSRLDPSFIVMVKLRKAGSHFPASGPRSCHNH